MSDIITKNNLNHTKLSQSFFENDDVVDIARNLIGKYLCTNINGLLTKGIIVETEAYRGETDRASHAYPNKLTRRTAVMFENGGRAYVYLCYGIHKLFNIVTNKRDRPDAVLIRAIEPVDGINIMAERRNMKVNSLQLTSGPGKLSSALGIELCHNGLPLTGNEIWLEDNGDIPQILSSKRIGVDYAGKDADLPWRFTMMENRWVSA